MLDNHIRIHPHNRIPMEHIIIREPFYGAGSPKIFNWVKDGYKQAGIGIAIEKLWKNDRLIVTFDGITHELNCQEALAFAKKYSSQQTRKGQTLLVISTSLFTEIFDEQEYDDSTTIRTD